MCSGSRSGVSVVAIEVAPLADRPEDVLPLAAHYLRAFSEEAGVTPVGFTADARACLESEPWSGDVLELRERVRRADGMLLGSPEYHNSFSGVLKNAIDLLSSEDVGGKLFGLLGVGGGDAGAINTLGHLRYVVRGVGGWSLPAQVSIPNAWQAFDGDRVKDAKLEERIRSFSNELVRFTRLHAIVPQFEAGLFRVIDEDPGA